MMNRQILLTAIAAIQAGTLDTYGQLGGPRRTDTTTAGRRLCKICGKICPRKKYACSPEHYREWMGGAGPQGAGPGGDRG